MEFETFEDGHLITVVFGVEGLAISTIRDEMIRIHCIKAPSYLASDPSDAQ